VKYKGTVLDKNFFSIGKTNLIIYDENSPTPESIEKNMDFKEKELFKIVRDCSVKEYKSIIEQKNDYYYLKHLSLFRENIVRWLPISSEDKVLEIGAEAGAVSAGLSKLSDNLILFEHKLTLARILAERFTNCKEIRIVSGDFVPFVSDLKEDGAVFNWIILYDSAFLPAAFDLCGENGHIVLVCDNRLGLKYFAGNKGEGCRDYFSYTEGRDSDGIIAYSEIEKLSQSSGRELSVFYPYPDYRFLKNLYSDRYLPGVGELVDNLNNFENDRMVLFSEKEAFDASCRDGSFKYISNSYLVIFGNPVDTLFVRFSNDRTDEHAIFTSITEKNGIKQVRKSAFCEEAIPHIKDIHDNYLKLVSRYENSPLRVNTCNLLGNSEAPFASFEFIEGETLEELMDRTINSGDIEGFYKLFDKYVKYLSFDNTGEITDIDAVFSNIIVKDDIWTLIDYEWCKQSRVEIRETAYRAVYCFIMEESSRGVVDLDLIRSKLELSKAATDEIEADEMKFQKMVTGKQKALGELREAFGHKAVNPVPLAEKMQNSDSGLVVQIYPSDAYGNFSEDTSYFPENAYVSEHTAEILIPIETGILNLRVDPMNNFGIVTIEECRINELDYPFDNKKHLVTNGKRINASSFVFNTEDPNMVFDMRGFVREEGSFFFLKLRVDVLPREVCESLCAKSGIFGMFN